MDKPFTPAVLRLVDQSLAEADEKLRHALRENLRARRNIAAIIEEALAQKPKRKARA